MNAFSQYRAILVFVGGVVAGVLLTLAVFRFGGNAPVGRQELDEQSQLIADLRKENLELTEDLFRYQGGQGGPDTFDAPYADDADPSSTVAAARQRALDSGKFLMVTFGANWCIDCLSLYRHLRNPEVRAFTSDTFDFVHVNVGKFNVNLSLASDLGVDLRRGIPVAIVFGPDGQVIGTTNDGQLEPSRYYTSKQILKFVRDIVEKSQISAPDSVR